MKQLIITKYALIPFLFAVLIGFPVIAAAIPTVNLTLDDGHGSEVLQDPGSFTVMRSNDDGFAEDLVIRVAISGSAELDIDYSRPGLDWPGGENFFITIPAQQASKSITITPYLDNLAEGEEIATFTLLDLGDTYIFGPDTEASVAIADNTDLVFRDGFGLPNPMPPIDVVAELATGDSVSSLIGAEGGVLSTIDPDGSSYDLTIPANALQQPTMITITPINALAVAPFAESLATSFVAGVQIEPSGLHFFQPLELKVVQNDGVDPSVWAWSYEGNGENLHPVAFTVDADTINVDIWHLSGWGISINWNEAIQNFGNFVASSAEQIAALAIQNATADPNAIDQAALIAIFLDWYIAGVRPMLTHAKTNPDLAVPALSQWDNWRAGIRFWGIFDSGALDNLLSEAEGLAKQVIRAAFNAAVAKCDGVGSHQETLADINGVLDWITTGQTLGYENDFPFDEILKCAEVRISDATSPARLDDNESGELKVRVGIHFKGSGGQTRYDFNPIVSLEKTNVSALPDGGLPDSEGWFTTTLTKEGDANATVTLTANSASGQSTSLPYESKDVETYTIRPKTSLSLLGKPEASGSFGESVIIEPQEQATIQATVFFEAAPSIGKTVTFTLDGEGSLNPSTPVLTDNDGLATVTFSAPAEVGQSTITASHTTDTAKLLEDSITISYGASVEVSPVAALVDAGGTVEFSATTTNLSPEKVTWSTTVGASIQSTGDLTATWTAPADAGSYRVIATSVTDDTIEGWADVTVELSAEPAGQFSEGFYYGRELHHCEFTPYNDPPSSCQKRIESMAPAWMRIHSDDGPTVVEFYFEGKEACGWVGGDTLHWVNCTTYYPHFVYRAWYQHLILPVGTIGSTTTLPAQGAMTSYRECYISCLGGHTGFYGTFWGRNGVIRFGENNVLLIERPDDDIQYQNRWIFVKDIERDPFDEWAFDPISLETPEEYRNYR